VDAELAGGLPQPALAGELVGLLGQLPILPVGTRLGKVLARRRLRSPGRVPPKTP
jgi:hypothetical protein